jgi:hypothetical protein
LFVSSPVGLFVGPGPFEDCPDVVLLGSPPVEVPVGPGRLEDCPGVDAEGLGAEEVACGPVPGDAGIGTEPQPVTPRRDAPAHASSTQRNFRFMIALQD